MKRYRYIFRGLVQGVGFRPFIYNLAKDLGLVGFVKNIGEGVLAEFQGELKSTAAIDEYIEKKLPRNAKIESIEKYEIEPNFDESDFYILDSSKGKISTIVPYDLGLCEECKREFYNKGHRHFMNPFISCINCGPRYTMIESLPYDRDRTSMKEFEFCDDCKKEYYTPNNRRFNAQSTTCLVCGPHLFLYSFVEKKHIEGSNLELLGRVCYEIEKGKIIAIKGIGGFHLVVDPYNKEVVERLFRSKKREGKPLALVCKSIETVKKYCNVSEAEEEIFNSPRCPIILFEKKTDDFLHVNGGLHTLGIMRAYTPILDYILTKTNRDLLIATSANLSGIPMIIDEDEALEKLCDIADFVLYHNRKIVRRCDDSVGFVLKDKFVLIRSGRGFAPITFKLKEKTVDKNILALGGHEKTTIALKKEDEVILSQYLGDLDTKEYIDFYEGSLKDLISLYDFNFDYIACDYHEDYFTTSLAKKIAKEQNKEVVFVQHHLAHIYSCMLEKNLQSCIGFAFDGTGLGLDGKIWGSEGFVIDGLEAKRVFHLQYYPLVGGQKAIKEPVRLAYYFSKIISPEFAESFFGENEFLHQIFKTAQTFNYPLTSSMGRLFDIVGVLLGCGEKNSFEVQIPMLLESIADRNESGFYIFLMNFKHEIEINIVDILQQIIHDIKRNINRRIISAKFHNTVAKIVVEVAKVLRENYNKDIVVLSGGVFQNKFLLSKTVSLLEGEGFKVFFNTVFPINDGGISAGQVYYTLQLLKNC
ncbi:carbamoyltransferase HypF [Caldicellulosiruptor naganoensis]|uniref:Carbamoyltransferase n=1 Tax=Caldicellulosiruptor naganoensis TaxID=29324 RepID=A0ABY7BFS4_9FIRM|nr:carbamoyltransferase HypF [Caldicellulosiruptor naganoensis]WAM30941.1 carbamoyltransferase HypF [Caldicellulosiruptor naganoensis]